MSKKSISPKKQTRAYHAWERANIAYRLTFHLEIPDAYSDEDSALDCESAVLYFFKVLYSSTNTNPITKRFRNLKKLMEWFDTTYPPIQPPGAAAVLLYHEIQVATIVEVARKEGWVK